MTYLKTASLGVAFLAFAGGAAFAQTNSTDNMSSSGVMSSGSMNSGAMDTSHMSKADMATMKRCQAMSHDMMMKDAKCMKMMKMHPDMMNNNPPMGH